MNIWLSLISSLLLTTFVSIATPLALILIILGFLTLGSYFPLTELLAEQGFQQVWHFLMMFGEGSGTVGILTISLVAGIAGFLFEALNFYRYQILLNHPDVTWLTQPKSEEFSKTKL
jgi:hypothetical protein